MARGSITKHRAKDGAITYRARIDAGIDPVTGRRKQLMETFTRRKAAQTWLAAQETAKANGASLGAGKQCYAAFLRDWLDGPASRRLRPNSVRAYASLITSRIIPALGAIAVRDLTPAHLERFLRDQEATAKPATVRTLHAILRRSLRDAERLGLRLGNPGLLVDGPRVERPEIQILETDEARRFLALADRDEDAALWRLMLTTGLRIGEALALRWADLDLETGTLQVKRTLTRNRRGQVTMGDATKSPSGVRVIPLHEQTAQAVRAHRLRLLQRRMERADVWQDDDLIFPGAIGTLRYPETVRQRLRKLCVAAGVPIVRIHALRHTCASILIAQGAHPRAVADLLGHADPSVTLRVYVKASPKHRRLAVDRLGRALQGDQ